MRERKRETVGVFFLVFFKFFPRRCLIRVRVKNWGGLFLPTAVHSVHSHLF